MRARGNGSGQQECNSGGGRGMDALLVDALASATKSHESGNGSGLPSFKALLLAGALVTGGLIAGLADASVVISRGTITSGDETGGLFGFPTATTSLVGEAYTLRVTYSGLG